MSQGQLGDSGLGEQISLCETLDRVLSKGVVLRGDITVSVAGVDLIYISLWALVTSVERALSTGLIQSSASTERAAAGSGERSD